MFPVGGVVLICDFKLMFTVNAVHTGTLVGPVTVNVSKGSTETPVVAVAPWKFTSAVNVALSV